MGVLNDQVAIVTGGSSGIGRAATLSFAKHGAKVIITGRGHNSLLGTAVGRSFKEIVSLVLYVAAILLAFVQPWIADVLYAMVAFIWIIPDRRIERALTG